VLDDFPNFIVLILLSLLALFFLPISDNPVNSVVILERTFFLRRFCLLMEAFAASARFARYIFRRTCIFLSVMHKLTLFLLWSFKNLIDPFIMFLGFGLLAVFTKELFECGINVECVVCSFVIAQGLFSCNFF
jgi:uncharacterized membrane protein